MQKTATCSASAEDIHVDLKHRTGKTGAYVGHQTPQPQIWRSLKRGFPRPLDKDNGVAWSGKKDSIFAIPSPVQDAQFESTEPHTA